MKLFTLISLKEHFWNSVKKITDGFSKLKVNNLGNGYVKCLWQISPIDKLRIDLSQSCFFAIRLFDISNTRNKNYSTCIMKEIEVAKYQNSISFPVPINTGVYYFEFGFRKRNGEWRKLAYQKLNFGYRIKKIFMNFDNSNWFTPQNRIENFDSSLHEDAYQLSLYKKLGGSEKLTVDN